MSRLQLDQKQEIDRTAAMIATLDAVVSAPTAVSWMSAGLGVATSKILYNNSWTSFGESYEPFAPVMPLHDAEDERRLERCVRANRVWLSPLLTRGAEPAR